MTKEELDALISKMTPSERAEFFALVQAEKKEPVFRSPEHQWQTRFLDDPSRMKALLCTRRAGKSYGAGLMLLEAAHRHPNVSCLYVALTRASAKRIMWKDVLKTIDREQQLGCRFNETELSVTLPNGSIIYLLGMDADEQEKEKALGQKFKAVAVDEAASYNVDLNEIIYGILMPATADYEGTIVMIGTPGNMKRGLFYELTKGQNPGEPGQWIKNGWSCYRWTAFENPKVARQWETEIRRLREANPLIEDTPLFQQHYLGKWTVDDSKLVYRFDYDRNVFDDLPTFNGVGRWHYVLGIDLGFNDPTAWVVCAYHDASRVLYVLGAHKKAHCDITEVAEQTKKLMMRFEFDRIIIDNANKQAVEEIRRRHDIPLTPAEKHGKADFIEIMNGDLISGNIKMHRKGAAPLMEEYGQLVWDERSPRREEHPACDNHACFVDGTRILTEHGEVPIELVMDADRVWTRNGWQTVEWCKPTGVKPVLRIDFSDGRLLTGTGDHPIWTENRGWVRLDALTATDVFVTSAPCEPSPVLVPSAIIRSSTPRSSFASRITSSIAKVVRWPFFAVGRPATQKPLNGTERSGAAGPIPAAAATGCISSGAPHGCTEPCGSITTASSRPDITSTTSTGTRQTTASKTLSAFPLGSTIGIITQRLQRTSLRHAWRAWRRLAQPLLRGTLRRKDESGIASTPSGLQPTVQTLRSDAKSAELSSMRNAQTAEFAVVRVTPVGTARVWALKVSGTPEYFANGVLVHNCDAMLYSWRHCYAYLSANDKPKTTIYGKNGEDWYMLEHEANLERKLEEKRYQDQELALYDDTL